MAGTEVDSLINPSSFINKIKFLSYLQESLVRVNQSKAAKSFWLFTLFSSLKSVAQSYGTPQTKLIGLNNKISALCGSRECPEFFSRKGNSSLQKQNFQVNNK